MLRTGCADRDHIIALLYEVEGCVAVSLPCGVTFGDLKPWDKAHVVLRHQVAVDRGDSLDGCRSTDS